MSSLLRSCKFVRFLAGITRNISFGNGRQDAFDIGANHNPNLYRGLAVRALATQQNISTRQESSLDKTLRQLDQDARRAGRISKKELDEILDEIRHSKSATSSQSLMVIRCCGSLVPEEHPEVRTKLVQEFWKTLESLRVPMDISHYNALLRVYLENGHQFSPTEFLAELEKKGVEPNRVTYQRLVSQHCQEGDMDGAAKILQTMRDKQMPINETVFNALVNGHAFNGDMESARGIFSVMKQAGLEPGAETYTALLCGHAKQGDIEAIRAVLAESEAQNAEILDRDLAEVIFSLAKAGHTEHIPEIIGSFKKSTGFNQECVNLILRLVNIGQENVAKKVLEIMQPNVRQGYDGPETVPQGTFFIRQLVKANRPPETILAICEELQSSGMNKRAYNTALEMTVQLGNVATSFALMQQMQKLDLPIRQHYFWPLLAANRGDKKAICQVLLDMQTLGISVRGETLRDYVLDSLKGSALDKLRILQSCGLPQGTATVAIVIYLLDEKKLKEAAEFVPKSKALYPVEGLRRPLAKAFAASGDTSDFVTIIQHTALSRSSNENDESVEKGNDSSSDEVVGSLVFEGLRQIRENRSEVATKVLQELEQRGLGLTSGVAAKLQELLGSDLSPEISKILSNLTSGSLEPQPLAAIETNYTEDMPLANMEMLYETLKTKGRPTLMIRRHLLAKYCRVKNLEKALEIKQSLDADNFVFTAGPLVLLMDLYTHHEKLEEALKVKQQLADRDPEFKIDATKLLKLSQLLINSGRFEDGLNIMKECENSAVEKDLTERNTFLKQNACWQILNELSDKKDEEKLQKVLDVLIEKNVVPINNVLLGPLIKLKLANDDLSGALEKFRWCAEQHRCTPWKSEITHRLIAAEDVVSLQKVTDISTKVHGEVNSLYDLAFAFVECGRIRQAKKIFETPGLRVRSFRLDNICERYRELGQVTSLEGLLEATKDLQNVDRTNIFVQLLKLYCKDEETEKAMNLWTVCQEENVQPGDEFLTILGKHLKDHNMEVPFAIPEKKQEVVVPRPQISRPRTTPVAQATPVQPKISGDQELQELKNSLRTKDVEKSLQIKDKMASKNRVLSMRDSTQLIDNLINANRVGEAFKIATEMLDNKMFPMARTFRYLLNKLANIGDVDGIQQLGQSLDDEQKKLLSYDNRLCNAYLAAKRTNEYLDQLTASLENAKSAEDFAKIDEKFPRGSALGILENCPELTEQLVGVAKKLEEKGHSAAINVIWMHFFVSDQHEAASKIWTEHLSKSERIMFKHICQESRKRNDPIICSNLLGLLITAENVSMGAKGNVLSCLLDVLVNKEMFDDALAALQAAHKDVGLEHVNRTALQRLQTGLEAQGKKFPFTIPTKNASQATTTSSSDDD